MYEKATKYNVQGYTASLDTAYCTKANIKGEFLEAAVGSQVSVCVT